MSGAAGAAAAAGIQAIKASGAIVRVSPDDFHKLLGRNPNGLVVHRAGGLFSTSHAYLMGYQGLAFYTKTSDALHVPHTCVVVEANRIWVP
jgi:hypothetical protein